MILLSLHKHRDKLKQNHPPQLFDSPKIIWLICRLALGKKLSSIKYLCQNQIRLLNFYAGTVIPHFEKKKIEIPDHNKTLLFYLARQVLRADCLLKCLNFIFRSSFLELSAKLRTRYRVPTYTWPSTASHDQSPHQIGTFVSTDEPTQTCHYQPKSPLCITVHSWCYTFHTFEQIYDDTIPPL